jgi:hypothetical protein
MIDTKALFQNGYVDLDILKSIINEMNSEIENLKNSKFPITSNNEKIKLGTDIKEEIKEDGTRQYYVETVHDILNLESVYLIADKLSENNKLISELISLTGIDRVDANRIYFKDFVDIHSFINLYATYNY